MPQKYSYVQFLFFVLCCTGSFAQKLSIKGSVVDAQSLSPIEYASITLVDKADNVAKAAVVSDRKGIFDFQNIQTGNYKIKIYFIGYEPQEIDNISLNNSDLQITTIKLKVSHQTLDEVVIATKKTNSYNKIDKQQYKASQFETAKGGSAIDIIRNLPSMTVNGQGEISLRGSNGFMVLINGKPVLTDAATILSQLPSNSIQNIELITAPSAKYDPDGKGGIINIVTTKNSTDGFALSANVLGGLPSTNDYNNLEQPQRYGTDVTANYKKDKIDLAVIANFQRNDNNGSRVGDVFTKNFTNNTITRFPSFGERSFDKRNYSIKTALNYMPNDANIFNVGIYLGKRFQQRRADLVYNNSTSNLLTNAVISQFPYFNSNVQTKEGNFTLANFDYTHFFKNKSSLFTSALYEHADLFGNTLNVNMDSQVTQNVFQRVTNPYTNPIYGIRMKLDYVLPLGTGKLESGYQYRYDNQNGNFGFTIDPEPLPPTDILQFSGIGKTTNNINAWYTQYSGKTEKLTYSGGLRYEYAERTVTLSNITNPNFLRFSNLFPSASALYTFNEAWNVKVGYSKRVQRNNNSELNPIPEREHSETLEQGDPDLLPQFVDLAEIGMNHTFKKGTLFTTLYYQNIKNPVQRVNSVFNDTILNRVYTNAGRARLLGMELGTNLKPKKWMSLYIGANIYNYRISGNINVLGQLSTVNNANWVYSINSNNTFNVSKNWSLTANVNYISAKVTAQGEDSRFFSPNLSVKRILFDGQGSVGFQWQHINFGNMDANKQRITTFGNDFFTTTNYIYETNVLLVNFNYNFNKLSSKSKLPTSEFGEKEF